MRSDKPEALSFQNWIASEVLPSIRKNGIYMTPKTSQELLDDPEVFLAKALLIAKETIDRQKRLLEEAAPKIELHDAFMDSSSTHSFTDVAKILGLPASVFIAYMAESRMLQKNKKGEWMPTKAYEGLGYFKVKIMPKFIHTRLTHEGFQWITKIAQERNWINKGGQAL
jgi:phage antirepressor YoqD-like protein